MARLNGQNVRIGIVNSGGDFDVVAMSTACVVTFQNNTEESSTKDDVSLASKPTAISKGWNIQFDSLNVTDAGALLTAIKTMTPLEVIFDETSTTDNYSAQHAAFARKGMAYFNDLSMTFNDRENSAKNVQMTGTGELSTVASGDIITGPATNAYTKGQFVRLFLGSDNTAAPATVIGAAKQLTLHISVSLENSTTKDTTGDYQVMEPTGISYDISTNALVRSNDTITSLVGAKGLSDLETIYENGTPVKWQIANVSGDNQRTKGSVIASGSALLSQLTLSAPNRQVATFDAQLVGVGIYTVGS